MTMYRMSQGLQTMETKGYVTVAVTEETSTNLAAVVQPSGSSLSGLLPREPKVDTSLAFNGAVNYQQISNATATTSAPFALTVSQSGSVVNNGAALAKVGATLPLGAPGMTFTFVCTAAAGFRVFTSGTDTIQVGSSVSTASTGHIDNATQGNNVELVCYALGTWVALGTVGTWTTT